LSQEDYQLTLTQRMPPEAAISAASRVVAVGDIGPGTEWGAALDGCDMVIHMAGQVPRRGVSPADFNRVNAAGTARLVEQAIAAGTKRFIYMSSVSAVVESDAKVGVDERTPTAPALSPYGESKREAELHIRSFAQAGRVGISIRPPLVYGPDARGRWGALQRLAASGLPLPFASVENRRSLIAIDNLVDALLAVIATAESRDTSGSYFVGDELPVSVRDMFIWLREGMGLPPRIFAVPEARLKALFKWIGQEATSRPLLGDLVIDSKRFREVFGWNPPLRADQAIRNSGAGFRAASRS
jgi:UDP-glucose 4-epimerase